MKTAATFRAAGLVGLLVVPFSALAIEIPKVESVDLLYAVKGWNGSKKGGDFAGTFRLSAAGTNMAAVFTGKGIIPYTYTYDGRRSLMVVPGHECDDNPGFMYAGCPLRIYLPFNIRAYSLLGPLDRIYAGLKPDEIKNAKQFVAGSKANMSVYLSPSGDGDYFSLGTLSLEAAPKSLFVGDPRVRYLDFAYEYGKGAKIGAISIPSKIKVKSYRVGTSDLNAEYQLDLISASDKVPPAHLPAPSSLLKKGMLVSYASEDKTSAGVVYDPEAGSLEKQAESQLKINRNHSKDGVLAAAKAKQKASDEQARMLPIILAALFGIAAIVVLISGHLKGRKA